MTTNITGGVTHGSLNNRLDQRSVKLSMNASNMAETKHGVAAHVDMRVRRKPNAQILSVTPIPVIHRNGDGCVTQRFGIVVTQSLLNLLMTPLGNLFISGVWRKHGA